MSLSRPARNFGAVVSEPTARGQAPLPGLRRSVRGARRVFRQVAREDRGFCYHAIDREKLDREDQAHYTGAPRRARVLALYLRDGPFVRRGPAEVSERPHSGCAAQESLRLRPGGERGPRRLVPLSPPLVEDADNGRQLTDGSLGSHWKPLQSLGWRLNPSETLTAQLDVDLGRVVNLGDLSQRYGAARIRATTQRRL